MKDLDSFWRTCLERQEIDKEASLSVCMYVRMYILCIYMYSDFLENAVKDLVCTGWDSFGCFNWTRMMKFLGRGIGFPVGRNSPHEIS